MPKLRHGWATSTVTLVQSEGTAVTTLGHGVRLRMSSLGAVCRKLGVRARKLGPEQDCRPTLCIPAARAATNRPQSVSNTKSLSRLESFLSQHYTSNRGSAANLAAYLKGQERPSVESQRRRGIP
jgi:hypothetical protein